MILIFALYVHSLPPKISEIVIDSDADATSSMNGASGQAFSSGMGNGASEAEGQEGVGNLEGESL